MWLGLKQAAGCHPTPAPTKLLAPMMKKCGKLKGWPGPRGRVCAARRQRKSEQLRSAASAVPDQLGAACSVACSPADRPATSLRLSMLKLLLLPPQRMSSSIAAATSPSNAGMTVGKGRLAEAALVGDLRRRGGAQRLPVMGASVGGAAAAEAAAAAGGQPSRGPLEVAARCLRRVGGRRAALT